MTLYHVIAECGNCGETVIHAEETDAPVALDQDVPISARFCPYCAFSLPEWDVQEECAVVRVKPTQERGDSE